jgi:hypothetical protein
MLKYLQGKGLLSTDKWRTNIVSEMIYAVTTKGNLKTLKWVVKMYKTYPNKPTITKIAKYGYLDVIKWLYKQGYPPDYKKAIIKSHKHPETTKWLKEHQKL